VIERYSLPAMAEVFSEKARLTAWLQVELAACEASEAAGLVPVGTAARISEGAIIDAPRAREIEAEVRHDVIAFLSMIAESGGEDTRHLHQGMTSSDLVDSAQAVILLRAGRLLETEIDGLRKALLELALRHRRTPCIGRSHGVHAEPISFGVKVLGWATEVRRAQIRLAGAVAEAGVGKLSGAVGNFAHLPPGVEADFCNRLGIGAEPIATQVVARDRMAALVNALALAAAAMERIALDIRLAQRTECGELFEPFGSGQKGSSAMPHKRNPILCERICGLARLLRGYATAAMENVALWEERDISHSSVERIILPDAFLATHYMAVTLTRIVSGLEVRTERMRENLDATRGLIFSGRVLLALVEAGVSRDGAYRLVQKHAMATLEGGPDFRQRMHGDPEAGGRLGETLAACFDLSPYLEHADTLFARGLAAAGEVASEPLPAAAAAKTAPVSSGERRTP
jgi:adenylosuccinate lyase